MLTAQEWYQHKFEKSIVYNIALLPRIFERINYIKTGLILLTPFCDRPAAMADMVLMVAGEMFRMRSDV